MSEQMKPEAIPEELTKEQLEGASGGAFEIKDVASAPLSEIVVTLSNTLISG